jgi:predicted acylesterase/phospholipase RssA
MFINMGLRNYLKNRELKRLGEDRYILCLDGGGMRGVIPATILEHVENLLRSKGDDRPLYSHFDLVSGTSTGGLIALALTSANSDSSLLATRQIPTKEQQSEPSSKKSRSQTLYPDPGPDIKRIADIYLKYGRIIFPRSQSFFQLNMINQLFTHKYDDLSFNQLLFDIFGERKIGQALTPTMVVTYDYGNDRPYILSNYGTPEVLLRTAARATSAAPTYFSPTTIHDPVSNQAISLLDGGVVANNPVLYAYKEAKRLYPDAKRFHVLSLSTSSAPYRLDPATTGSGVFSWLDPAKGTPIYRLYASSQMRTSHEIASAIGDMEYIRIHGDLHKRVKLDETDPVVLSHMIKRAQQIFTEHEQQITALCDQFIQRPMHPPRSWTLPPSETPKELV